MEFWCVCLVTRDLRLLFALRSPSWEPKTGDLEIWVCLFFWLLSIAVVLECNLKELGSPFVEIFWKEECWIPKTIPDLSLLLSLPTCEYLAKGGRRHLNSILDGCHLEGFSFPNDCLNLSVEVVLLVKLERKGRKEEVWALECWEWDCVELNFFVIGGNR